MTRRRDVKHRLLAVAGDVVAGFAVAPQSLRDPRFHADRKPNLQKRHALNQDSLHFVPT